MEGIPRLPMLRSVLKTTPEKTDFSRKIKWQIREHFNEDPNSYMNEIKEIESLRALACHPPQDFSGCSLLKKYYCQLHFLQNRFSFEETGRDEIYFTWNDLYTEMAYSTTDIKHELACILYNIGALHTVLGAMDNRQTSDGMKMSCSHFQCAAWAFQQLNERFPQPRETDLCQDIIRFLGTVSLAQAQECILEKSIVDARKPGIVAKVAAQIVDYYKTALKVLEQSNNSPDGNSVVEVAGSKTYKSWKKYAEFKMAFHQSVALLYMGIHSEELQKMGERLAYYQAAMDKLTEATKLAKKVSNYGESINDAVSFTHDVVGGKLKAAEKENEFVYHEKVPERSALPEIKGASLVKGTSFDVTDPEIAGQDIFQRLVPMEAHEASSLYSEEKAKLLRRIGGMIDEKDQELTVFLTSLQVDQLRLHQEPSSLPQELVDCCAAFSVESDAAQSLIEAMGQLSSVYTDVEASLNEAQQLLNEEQQIERQSQGKRPPSMILKELSLEASRYADAHAKAADSNMLLHKAINSHLGNLKILSLPLSEIQTQLPSLQALESSKDQASIKELQRLLDKVEEMRKQRIMLYNQLRDAIQSDDITKLTTHQTDLESLFSQELAKHQRLTSLIEQNLSAQEKILVALTEANARYADTRRSTADIYQRRANMVTALLAAADAYPDLQSKTRKGLEFYRKMDANVTKLLQRLRSVCRVQQEEREQQEAARERMQRPTVVAPAAVTPSPIRDVAAEGPKLKDFLHLMKKDKTNGDPMGISASSTIPTSYPTVGTPDMASYNYPYHRPAPLGAEQNDQPLQPFATDGNSYYYHPSAATAATITSSGSFGSSYSGAPLDGHPATSTAYSTPSFNRAYGYTPTPQHMYTQFPTDSTSGPTGSESSRSGTGTYTLASTINYPSTSLYSNSSTASVPPSQPSGVYSSQMVYPIPATQAQPMAVAYPTSMAFNPTTVSKSSPTVSPTHQPITTTLNNNATSTNTYPPMSFNQSNSAGPITSNSYVDSQSHAAFSTANQLYSSTSTYANQSTPATTVAPSNVSTPAPYSTPHQSYSIPTGYASQMPHQPSTMQSAEVSSINAYTAGLQNFSGNQSVFNPYSQGTPSSYVNPQYSAYPSTTSYGNQPQQYGYSGQYSYNTQAGSGNSGYQHGFTTTGTTNTAPSSGQANYQSGYPAAASGPPGPQYQQYPYYPSQQPAAVQDYYPSNSYYPTDSSGNSQPTPASQGVSNVDLLTLLDLSVPNPSSGTLLEPQSRENLTNTNTHGTTTLTTTHTKTVMESVPAAPLVSSPFESILPTNVPVLIPSASSSTFETPKAAQTIKPDPLADAESVLKLAADVDKLDKLVDGLTRKSLNGPTALDTKWKEVQDLQERESARRSISVARCYPMKNRLPDVLPYDHNRVDLPTTKDDYINASLITALSPNAPSFIATQTPLPCSQQDFWTMIWQRQVEIAVCLLSDAEMPKTGAVYWPVEKGRDLISGPWTISLQTSNVRPYCHERILSLTKQGENKQRVLIHLQFTAWPGSSFPASPAQFLQLANEVFHFWQQQRSTAHPIVVHCLAGAGRTGLFCLITTALADLASGHGLVDIVRLAAALCQQRRNMFRDREHLLFAYQSLLYHAQDILMKRGILSGTGSLQGSPTKKSHPSQDFIHSQSSSRSATPHDLLTEHEGKIQTNTDAISLPTDFDEIRPELPNQDLPGTSSSLKEEQQLKESPVAVEPKKTGALAILDPANFTLDGGTQPNRHRVTKESFNNKNTPQIGAVNDPSDPLSTLDPLWSLAK